VSLRRVSPRFRPRALAMAVTHTLGLKRQLRRNSPPPTASNSNAYAQLSSGKTLISTAFSPISSVVRCTSPLSYERWSCHITRAFSDRSERPAQCTTRCRGVAENDQMHAREARTRSGSGQAVIPHSLIPPRMPAVLSTMVIRSRASPNSSRSIRRAFPPPM
jgi:hypothetical protein